MLTIDTPLVCFVDALDTARLIVVDHPACRYSPRIKYGAG